MKAIIKTLRWNDIGDLVGKRFLTANFNSVQEARDYLESHGFTGKGRSYRKGRTAAYIGSTAEYGKARENEQAMRKPFVSLKGESLL